LEGAVYSVKIIGPNGEDIEDKLQDNEDGTYEIEYKPTEPGNYNVQVLQDDSVVKEVTVTVSDRADPRMQKAPDLKSLYQSNLPFLQLHLKKK